MTGSYPTALDSTPPMVSREDCEYRPAHPALRSVIPGYYVLRNPNLLAGNQFIGLCKCSLFFHFFYNDRKLELSFGTKNVKSTYQGILSGQIVGPTSIFCKDPLCVITVEMLPIGMMQLFGISALDLKEQIVSVSDLHFADFDRLIDQLRHQTSIDEHKVTLDDFFLRRFLYDERIDSFCACVDLLFRSSGTATVNALRKRACLSKRQFERRFKEQAGISASVMRRFIRSNCALGRILQNESVFKVVEGLGYVDQSHLIKDIKWYTGKTPSLLRNQCRNRVIRIGSATFILG